jgi:acyl-CoA synthetase (NDP forming)
LEEKIDTAVGKLQEFEAIFNPQSVAVIGASDDPAKLGYHVMKSLVGGGFPGKIFPINPGRKEVFGLPAFSSPELVQEKIDLAIVVLPAKLVPEVLEACGRKGIKGAVLIPGGFREIEDKSGEKMQEEITQLANRAGIKVIGPNTFGMFNLHKKLNASFTPDFSKMEPGPISLISQSGGIAHLLGFLAAREKVGLGKVIGLGNRCNVDFAEMLECLVEDPDTKVIAIYIEGLDDPRRLIETAQKVRGRKPLLVYKAGRSQTSDKAAKSHTGSLAGNYEVYQGAFRQAGMLTVGSSEELLDAAKALALCQLPRGNRVAVVSGQAGLAMVASDFCEREGLVLSPFSEDTQRQVNELLPPLTIRTNPVDLGPAWYNAEAMRGIIQLVLSDENIDAMIFCIVYASINKHLLKELTELFGRESKKKPILTCISAPEGIWDDDIHLLQDVGVANFSTPERAARALGNLIRYLKISSG